MTRKCIEIEEKEKSNLLQLEKEKVRKLISDGIISPDKPGSYTFSYDGKILPVAVCQFIPQKKDIQVEGRETNEGLKNIRPPS